MATRLEDEFDPTRINAPDAAYPAGSLKDETTPGVSDDGTPLASRVGNDWQGFSQSALDKAGIAANGQPDSVSNPQILQAIEQMYNDGDSQLAGGNIWPLSSQDSAQVGDDFTGYQIMRVQGGIFTENVLVVPVPKATPELQPEGIISSLDLSASPIPQCEIGGVDCWLASKDALDSKDRNLEIYYPDTSGIVDTTFIMSETFKYWNVVKSCRQHSGVFLLSSTSNQDITINTNADLSGSIFRVDDWNGNFIITRDNEPITYDATSDVVIDSNASPTLAGYTLWPGLDGKTETEDCILDIRASRQMFQYRGAIQTRVEVNHMMKNGVAMSPTRYDYQGDITTIKALKIMDSWMTVKGLSFDLVDIDSYLENSAYLIDVRNATKVTIEDVSISSNTWEKSANATLIELNFSGYIRLKNVFQGNVNYTTSSTGFTYTFGSNFSYDVIVNGLVADGDGWAATTSNYTAKLVFDECKISRVDCHLPNMDFMKVLNSEIGAWGINGTMYGDIIVDNVEFVLRESIYDASGIIGSRPDAGGWVDGNLFMTNVKVRGVTATSTGVAPPILKTAKNTGEGPVVGSPINNRYFDTVYIDGITFINVSPNLIIDGSSTLNKEVKFPRILDINKLTVTPAVRAVTANLDLNQIQFFAPPITPVTRPAPASVDIKTNYINFNNSEMDTIDFLSDEMDFNFEVNMRNCFGINGGRIRFRQNQRGVYNIQDCALREIDTEINGGGTYFREINMTRGELVGIPSRSVVNNSLATIKARGTTIGFNNSSDAFRVPRQISLIDCDLYQTDDLQNVTRIGDQVVQTNNTTSFNWTFSMFFGVRYTVRVDGSRHTFTYTGDGDYVWATTSGKLSLSITGDNLTGTCDDIVRELISESL